MYMDLTFDNNIINIIKTYMINNEKSSFSINKRMQHT